jgi:hypothetical protein
MPQLDLIPKTFSPVATLAGGSTYVVRVRVGANNEAEVGQRQYALPGKMSLRAPYGSLFSSTGSAFAEATMP